MSSEETVKTATKEETTVQPGDTAKVTVTDESETHDEDGMPPLENALLSELSPDTSLGGDEASKKSKQTRSEKKSRKAMQKLGLKPINGIVRVTVKKAKNILFVISKPDVFKSPASDTYVIFGEAKIEDQSGQQLTETAKQFERKQDEGVPTDDDVPPLEAIGTPEPSEVDETGVEAKDIELVMSQTKGTRAQAVAALKKTGGDIINAIMESNIG